MSKHIVRMTDSQTTLFFHEEKTHAWVINQVWKICIDFSASLDTIPEKIMVIRGVEGMEEYILQRLHDIEGVATANTEYDYDDNEVYRTGERSLDSRLDCRSTQGYALLTRLFVNSL